MAEAALFLVRHCRSTGQTPEAPLTGEGFRDADTLGATLEALGADAAYSSPFVRARQSLEPFAVRAGLTVSLDERFRERLLQAQDSDDWLDLLRASFADDNYRAPGGETMAEARARAMAALADVVRAGHRLPAVATHGNLLASVLMTMNPAFGFADWQALRNPELVRIVWRDGGPESYEFLAFP